MEQIADETAMLPNDFTFSE